MRAEYHSSGSISRRGEISVISLPASQRYQTLVVTKGVRSLTFASVIDSFESVDMPVRGVRSLISEPSMYSSVSFVSELIPSSV